MKRFLKVFLSYVILFYAEISANSYSLTYFKSLLAREHIEYEIKSTRGWYRTIENKDLMNKYNLFLTPEEIKISEEILRKELKNNTRDRSIK
jgi:hypothetical protein